MPERVKVFARIRPETGNGSEGQKRCVRVESSNSVVADCSGETSAFVDGVLSSSSQKTHTRYRQARSLTLSSEATTVPYLRTAKQGVERRILYLVVMVMMRVLRQGHFDKYLRLQLKSRTAPSTRCRSLSSKFTARW